MARPLSDHLARQLATTAGKSDSRRRLIGAVRAAAHRLGLSDDDRRAIQAEETGKASLAEMSLGEIGRVLDRLNRDRPAPMAHRAHLGKIKALWWTLYWLGEVDQPGEVALDAFVRRQTGVAALRFLDHRRAPAVIEALKAMAARAGVRWPDDSPLRATADRRAVADAIWRRLYEAVRVSDPHWDAYAAAAIGRDDRDTAAWSAHELDAVIRALGKKLRRDAARITRAGQAGP